MKRPIIAELLTSAGVAALSALDRWLNSSAHPVVVRVRDLRPTEWPSERVERELREQLAELKSGPSTKPESSK